MQLKILERDRQSMMVNVCKYESNPIISFFGRGHIRLRLDKIQNLYTEVFFMLYFKNEDWEILKSSVRKYCSNYNMAEEKSF